MSEQPPSWQRLDTLLDWAQQERQAYRKLLGKIAEWCGEQDLPGLRKRILDTLSDPQRTP